MVYQGEDESIPSLEAARQQQLAELAASEAEAAGAAPEAGKKVRDAVESLSLSVVNNAMRRGRSSL